MTDTLTRVLVAVDDPATRAFLTDNLVFDGYAAAAIADGEQLAGALDDTTPIAAVIVDADRLDDVDAGLSSRHPQTAILALGAPTLNRPMPPAGAVCDWIAKPFSYQELRQRLRAAVAVCATDQRRR